MYCAEEKNLGYVHTYMIGLVIVILSALGLMYSSYQLGLTASIVDLQNRSAKRNAALTAMAVCFAMILLGVLSAVGGSANPMTAVISPPPKA